MLFRIPTDYLQNLTEFSHKSHRIPVASLGTRDKSSEKLRRFVSGPSFSFIQFIGRCLQEFQTQAKNTSLSDAARRFSRSELGSAAPRPLRGKALTACQSRTPRALLRERSLGSSEANPYPYWGAPFAQRANIAIDL